MINEIRFDKAEGISIPVTMVSNSSEVSREEFAMLESNVSVLSEIVGQLKAVIEQRIPRRDY